MMCRFSEIARFSVLAGLGAATVLAASVQEWRSVVPSGKGDALQSRLDSYVKANRSRNWGKLYDLVSGVGRGGVDRQTFVARMKGAHGVEFANLPDLLEFRPERAAGVDKAGYDIYGCGKASREGREFNGVALAHAVFEHDKWFFTGWTFTEFPNKPCKALASPTWEAPGVMDWNRPMEEMRASQGVPFHFDKPK